MAELPLISDEGIAWACDESGYEIYEPTEGNSASWGFEIDLMRQGNPQALNALREDVLRQFGISSIFQTHDGGIFIIPEDSGKPCVGYQPAGVS